MAVKRKERNTSAKGGKAPLALPPPSDSEANAKKNDKTDPLDVKFIAQALAELLYGHLKPPFVIGILGKWGMSSDSTFFNLMLEHVATIQHQPHHALAKQGCGHLFVIEFSAWTHSKGDIWSALMYTIQKSLNEQLQFEQHLDDQDLKDGKVSTTEVFTKSKTKEGAEDLKKSHDKSVWKAFQKVKQNGDQVSELLLKTIDSKYQQDKDKLKQVEKELSDKKGKVKAKQDTIVKKKQVKVAHENVNRHLNAFGKKELEKQVKAGKLGDVDSLLENIKWYHHISFSDIPVAAIAVFVLFVIAASLCVKYENQLEQWYKYLAGLLAGLLPIIQTVLNSIKKMEPVLTDVKKVATDIDCPDLENLASEGLTGLDITTKNLTILQGDIETLEGQKAELKTRGFAPEAKGVSLKSSIAKKSESSTNKTLSVVHTAQEDLDRMTEGMLGHTNRKIFPRGKPRIALFVNDLDKCQHHTVVEVIEAIQLMVSSELFVAVVAMDPRYVTNAVEKHFGDLLSSKKTPTGMDYLEKFVQVPVRLPGLGDGTIDKFLSHHIAVETGAQVDAASSKHAPAASGATTTVGGELSAHSMASTSTQLSQDDKDDPPGTNPSTAPPLPAVTDVTFTPQEETMMKDVFNLFGVEPSCMKRIIKVFKVLKVIWKRSKDKNGNSSSRYEESEDVKCATLFLMLLASDPSTSDVTYKVFHWMESGSVLYHRVMKDDKEVNNLANLIETELKKTPQFQSSGDEAKYQGALFAHIDKYLSSFEWHNSDEWNEISSKFMLARCFSFFRLVVDEMDIEQQKSMASLTTSSHHKSKKRSHHHKEKQESGSD